MKTSTAFALALVASLGGLAAAQAQTAEPAPYHHDQTHRYQGPHHTVHHHVAHNPTPAPAPAATTAPQAAPFGLALPHIAPYPNNKGDEDGLSTDVNDCNKGCIGGAPD